MFDVIQPYFAYLENHEVTFEEAEKEGYNEIKSVTINAVWCVWINVPHTFNALVTYLVLFTLI